MMPHSPRFHLVRNAAARGEPWHLGLNLAAPTPDQATEYGTTYVWQVPCGAKIGPGTHDVTVESLVNVNLCPACREEIWTPLLDSSTAKEALDEGRTPPP